MQSSRLISGTIAGVVSSLAFTILHGAIISNIWFMLIPMMAAGAMCGFSLSWSYALLEDSPSIAGWLRYNSLFIVFLFMLGPISLVLFDPIMTIPELLASPNGLPDELFREVLPLVAVYTPFMALIITRFYAGRWFSFGAVLVPSVVLVFLLGLNIAPMGLVYLTGGWTRMLLELVGLIVILSLVYALVYLFLTSMGLKRVVDWGRQLAR